MLAGSRLHNTTSSRQVLNPQRLDTIQPPAWIGTSATTTVTMPMLFLTQYMGWKIATSSSLVFITLVTPMRTWVRLPIGCSSNHHRRAQLRWPLDMVTMAQMNIIQPIIWMQAWIPAATLTLLPYILLSGQDRRATTIGSALLKTPIFLNIARVS